MKVERKFENNLCAHTLKVFKTQEPTFLQCLMSIDTWKFETTLKAPCIYPLVSIKFDLFLCYSIFVLSTIEWCIFIQTLKVLAIKKANIVDRKPLLKVKRLELGMAKCTL